MNIVGRDDLFIFFMVLEMKGMGRGGGEGWGHSYFDRNRVFDDGQSFAARVGFADGNLADDLLDSFHNFPFVWLD
jgi:hypothetical protein